MRAAAARAVVEDSITTCRGWRHVVASHAPLSCLHIRQPARLWNVHVHAPRTRCWERSEQRKRCHRFV